jgi:hypothetical protein
MTAPETSIADLPGTLVASFAQMSFVVSGRNRWTAGLLHRALDLEPSDVVALSTLSGFLDDGALATFPSGFKMLSAIVLERLLAPESLLSSAEKARLDDERFLSMWGWKFSRHRDGKTELVAAEFRDRTRFVVDDDRYRAWWNEAVTAAGSFDAAFDAATCVPGFLAGFFKKRSPDVKASVAGAFHRADLVVDRRAYDEWLAMPATALDGIEQSFDRAKKKSD